MGHFKVPLMFKKVPLITFWGTFESASFTHGENSLFDILLKCDSLFDTGKKILPYLTSIQNFFPYMTL
jgi:hypothetical protein